MSAYWEGLFFQLPNHRAVTFIERKTVFLFQVSICPECREPYPTKPRRHRYAEKAAEELDALKSERAEILDADSGPLPVG